MSHFLRTLLAALTALLLPIPAARATWYAENIENGADIIMMDLRWPWWASGTYYANWNSSFNPKPNNITFYAGFTSTVPDGPDARPNPDPRWLEAFRPGSVWSFWGSSADGTPVRFLDCAPNLFIRNMYGGEGLSGTLGAEGWPFIKAQRWYTMLGRVWQPIGGGQHAYAARWIKDHADGQWHLIAMARLPIPATSFTGNSGFIEPLTGEKVVRPLHRRLGYFRKDGQWKKSDTITIDKTQYVVVNTLPEGDHEYAAIEYSQRPDLLPIHLRGSPLAGDQKFAFTTKQPAQPVLDQPAVINVRAEGTGKQVAVSWEIPPTASPAFAYRIEVFDNPACTGLPKAVREERMPNARHALLDASVATPTVRLTVTDIFDQSAPPVVVPVAAARLVPAQEIPAAAMIPRLAYTLKTKDERRKENYFYPALQKPGEEHRWLTLSELDSGKLESTGLSRGFDLSVTEQRTSGYGVVFSGFLRVPSAGLYILRAGIDGAYRVRLAGADALARDGQKGTTEQAAVVRLSPGLHPIEVTHVYDQLSGRNFTLEWEGPGIPRQPIPLDVLLSPEGGAAPTVSVKGTAPGDGTGSVTVTVEPRAHQVAKTVLFLGPLQLAESKGASLQYTGPLPGGANTFWSRVTYDTNHTVDSDPVDLAITGKPVDAAWTVRNVGDQRSSAGLWQTGPDAFRFFGSGMHIVTKKVTGDFTATCRLDDYNGARGEPVNRHAWAGLSAREHGTRLNWEWGGFFHLVQTAADGLRASADNSDLGASRLSSYSLPKDHPWLRIVRQGNVWTAWSSKDGAQWVLGAYQFKKLRSDLDVGLFFSALPQETRAHYHASVSYFSIVPGVVPETAPPLPVTARHTGGDRLTGVVVSRTDSKVVVVRSSAAGLLRTIDGGKSWGSANGALDASDLPVRSVAIHPSNPLVMLRAGGSGRGGSLWRTMDGGLSWTALPFPGDFDGTGPSALCGEVLAYDLRDPRVVYAGCESAGFFKSTDAGDSWRRIGLAGERVTAVTVWAWEQYYPAVAKGKTQLCVTTCPDQWMSFLGRGQPAIPTPATTTRSYISNDDVATLTLMDERADTGFFNVAFDKATQSAREMSYATAHGYQGNSGSHLSLYPEQKNLEWLRPFTALGTAARGEQKFGHFLTQALDPVNPGRMSLSQRWGMEWSWLPTKGAVPKGGLIAVCADVHQGAQWWFVHTDGLYCSSDGGTTLSRVLDEKGARP